MTNALRAERRPPHWLGEARALLHDRYRENLRLADIAGVVGVHPVHLARVFRLRYGTPVGSYTRGLRLSWAAGRLRDSDDAIAAHRPRGRLLRPESLHAGVQTILWSYALGLPP